MLTSLPARCACAAITVMVVTVWAISAPLASAQAATPKMSSASTAVLAQGVGMRHRPSARVRRLQRILERAGFDVGPPGTDGRFGPFTAAAVRRMQNAYGLVPDGIVGPKTRRVVGLMADRQQLRRRRARDRSQTTRRRAPQSSATPGAAPRPTTPAQPTPGRPTVPSEAIPAQHSDTTVPMVLAAIALLMIAMAVAVALVRSRRPSGAANLVGVPRDLYLEGQSRDEHVGTFGGFVLAIALPSGDADDSAEERYLLDDPRKPAPVWVRGSEIRRSMAGLRPGETVLGYVTAEEHSAREHQQFIDIEEACAQAGWELKEIIRDTARGRMSGRPGLARALEDIAAGHARGLVTAEVRRMVRSAADLGSLLERFRDAGAALIALDLGLDTSTVLGQHSASTLMALAAWERDRAQSRQRSGIASVKGSEGTRPKRRPATDDRDALVGRISAMRRAGMTLQAIADQLNDEGVPVLRGGARWGPSAVQAALSSSPRTSGHEQLPPVEDRERGE